MGNNRKWLGVIGPDNLISEVACEAILSRSRTMLEFLPLAANKWKDDVEYVHQLRTWSRRTQAALQLFASLLPLKRANELRKAAQRLRKSAGNARDLDVFIKRIRKAKFQIGDDDREEVQVFLRKLRKEAQPELIESWGWAETQDLPIKFQSLVEKTRWREAGDEESLGQIAPTLLTPLVERFVFFSQQLSEDPNSLHRMRIEGKKVRYAMELVEKGFPEHFRDELIPAFEEVQSKLGAINDHHTAIDKIERWHGECRSNDFPAFLLQLRDHEKVQYQEKSEAFRQWWTEERLQELKRQFDRYLGSK